MAASAALAIGCGGAPSQLEACKHFCDKQGSCTNAGSAAVSQCKSACDANKAQFSDADKLIENVCANASEVKSAVYDCYGDFCDQNLATQCADAAGQNKCVAK